MSERARLVSVVVPTRNRAHLLARLLEALERQDYPSYEVIVVDDASRDHTPDVLAAWCGERRRSLRLPRPSGSYAARNRGIAEARGELIAFTDDDCVPESGWLSALANVAAPPHIVGVQGVTRAGPGEVTPFTQQIEALGPGPPDRTCNIMYRRSLLHQLGGFDERLPWYADNILGLKARRIGTIAFASDAVVLHPPRAREWRDRTAWLARFRADAHHRRELRRLGRERFTPRGATLAVVLWILRPLLKQSLAHVRYAGRHPLRYVREARPMVREKRDLLLALRDFRSLQRMEAGAGPGSLPDLAREPLVSVIIVTRDRPDVLQGALAALARQTWQRYELILVDHGRCERTRSLARREGARYIPAFGTTLAWARQAGVGAASGEIVVFTDDDCLPAPDWLEAVVRAFHETPNVVGVQGRTIAVPGPVGSHAVEVSHPDPLYQTCNMAYRRTALQRAGGFDLRFSAYFEDTALAARVLNVGPIGFAPDAVVTHRAMPRTPLDREAWRILLRDEHRLARDYRAFYRRTRGPGFLATVVARWLLGSPLKSMARNVRWAPNEPREYLRLFISLLGERKQLILALLMDRQTWV